MKGDKKIVINFNNLLTNELIAVNQYFLHSRIFKHLGLARLSNIEYLESKDEMEHVDCYIKRILFLEGALNVTQTFNLCNNVLDKDVERILRIDLNLEVNIVNNLRECVAYADTVRDFVSRDIMVKILIDEEKHVEFLETELFLITQIGIHNYLQSQLIKDVSFEK